MNKIILGFLLIALTSCGNKKENFTWDFNTNKNYNYSISQTTTSDIKTSKDEKSKHTYISGNGKLIVKSKSNDLADISITDLKARMTNSFTKDTISQSQPNSLIQDLRSDGKILTTLFSNDFIRLLFALPTEDLSLGASSKIPSVFPFNMNGSVINSKGFNRLTFVDYEIVDGHNCAVLWSVIDISKLDLPDDFKGNYTLSKKGTGVYYFDIENRHFVKSKINISVTTLIDNEDFYINSTTTNQYEINLIDVSDSNQPKPIEAKSTLIEPNKNSPSDIAISVIEFLQKKDTVKYLDIAIPLEKQKLLFAENIKYNPQENDTMAVFRTLKNKYAERTDNFLVRAGYILNIMKRDKGFDIEKATIDSIYYKLEKTKQYGGFGRTIIGDWADLVVEMKFENEIYYFEIPQIIKVENQWYLYYPEYYLRDERDKQFIDKRVKELKQQAEAFWK